MVAYISGSPNPVIFKYSDVVLHHQLDVHVGWDTGDPAVKAWVWRSVDGGAEKRLPGAAAPTGSVDPDPQIALDQVLTFVLRRSTNMQEIGRTTVVTEKNALATAMTDPDLDFIFALKVDPLVDSIHVAFRTKQPAVAYVEIRRQDSGELVDLRMGSSFGQQHDNVFSGFGNGLAQDTAFDMRIVALKDIGGGRVALGSGAKNPEIKGSVTTGARTVTVLFDLIHVRNDGDPAGAGEFTFLFGVGDVDTQLRLGTAPSWGEGDISSGGDREVARTVTIEHAPRRMWAQVVAWEDDTSVGDLLGHPLGLGFAFPSGPGFAPAGSDSYEVAEGSAAWVTMHFDIEQIATDRQAGFEMSTKDFTISYDVFGSITVRRRNGVNNFKGLALGRVKHQPPQISHPIRVHSRTLPVGKTQQVALSSGVSQLSISPDGSVLLRRSDPLARAGFVADLGGCFHDSVTVVAPPRELEPRDGGRPPASGDTVHVLGITHEGQVVVRTLTGESTGLQWCPLGG
ncbi:MAG TPA: hypothetical protein VLR26_14090, partial [Frankiaceae bacterium]|nr:hypothetical protein [Frankiaceae bacterium]